MALEDVDVTAPSLRDELLTESVEATLEEALGWLDSVLDTGPLALLKGDVDTPAEVVLGKPDDTLDTEAPTDVEMLLVVNAELLRGGEVNGWLDYDTVDSGYGPV